MMKIRPHILTSPSALRIFFSIEVFTFLLNIICVCVYIIDRIFLLSFFQISNKANMMWLSFLVKWKFILELDLKWLNVEKYMVFLYRRKCQECQNKYVKNLTWNYWQSLSIFYCMIYEMNVCLVCFDFSTRLKK